MKKARSQPSPSIPANSTPGSAPRLSPRLYVTLLFLLVALVLLTSDKGQIAGDGIKRWEALNSLMSHGELTSDKYSIVQPLFAVPLYGIGEAFAAATGASAEKRSRLIRHTVQRFNKTIAFLTAFWLYLLLRIGARWNYRQSSGAVIFLLFGTLLIPHAKDFYSECLWSLLCISVITMLSHLNERTFMDIDKRMSLLFVLITSLIIPLNPLLLIVFGLLVVQLTIRRVLFKQVKPEGLCLSNIMKADVVLVSMSLAVGATLCVLENWIRRGSILNFGYPGEGFSTPFLAGFMGQLVSPARGVIFFMPTFLCGLILLLQHRADLSPYMRRLVQHSMLFCFFLLIAYSKWHAWHGAWYWGPRFLLPLSVFGCFYYVLLASFWWHSKSWKHYLIALLGVVSFMIYKVGVGVGQGPLIECLEATLNSDHCYWRWTFTPLAAWCSAGDIFSMLRDRSTAVELASCMLAMLLLRFAPSSARPIKARS